MNIEYLKIYMRKKKITGLKAHSQHPNYLEGCWRAQRPQLIRGGAGRGRTPVDCVWVLACPTLPN